MSGDIHVTALAHDRMVESLSKTINSPTATVDEIYFARLLRDILAVAGDHPGIIHIINRRVLDSLEKQEHEQETS